MKNIWNLRDDYKYKLPNFSLLRKVKAVARAPLKVLFQWLAEQIFLN